MAAGVAHRARVTPCVSRCCRATSRRTTSGTLRCATRSSSRYLALTREALVAARRSSSGRSRRRPCLFEEDPVRGNADPAARARGRRDAADRQRPGRAHATRCGAHGARQSPLTTRRSSSSRTGASAPSTARCTWCRSASTCRSSDCCSSSARSSKPCRTSRRARAGAAAGRQPQGQHGDLLRGDLRRPDPAAS